MKQRICPYIVVLLIAILAQAQDTHTAGDKLSIKEPSRDGMPAACRVTVQGRAFLKQGEHAWAFAARSDFANVGLVWLQGEVDVDPASHEYSQPMVLGVPDDVGSVFRVSIGIVDQATHDRLRNKLVEMMTTNRHLPVPFPQTVSAPKFRTVKKVSHEGC